METSRPRGLQCRYDRSSCGQSADRFTVGQRFHGLDVIDDSPLTSRRPVSRRADVDEAIAQVVHDQGVEQAMRAYVAASVANGRDIAGVMGGASTPRDAPAYRLAAQTAKALSEAGFLVATGGGLGIMEAGNLGAYFAGRPHDELDAAIDDLKRCPTY